MAVAVCFRSAFDPEFLTAEDYAITADGVCYYGFDTDDLPGCRDSAGTLLTTTTHSFVSGDTSGYVEAIGRAAPPALEISTNPDLALTYGQELCTELRDWSGYEYAKWLVDVEVNGVGREGIPADQWSQAQSFVIKLPRLVATHLCPEQADGWEESYSHEQEFFDTPSELTFGGIMGEAIYFYDDPALSELRESLRDSWKAIGREICANFDEGSALADQRQLAIERVDEVLAESAVVLAEPERDFLARTVTGAAVEGFCPRHTQWYWDNLAGDFDPID